MANDCTHNWRRLYEEFLLGGAFLVGWECTKCGEMVDNADVTPAGLPGSVSKNEMRLVGPHGGYGRDSKGRPYKEQIVTKSGKLIVKR